jgi:glycosyltransferase involved in cell wall biosynthesis
MGNILYLCRLDLQKSENSGVAHKITAQCKALERLGHRVDLLSYGDAGMMLNGELVRRFSSGNMRYNYYLRFYQESPLAVDPKQYDLIYVRYHRGSFMLPGALKDFKQRNPRLAVAVEMPSYPFDAELTSWTAKTINVLDNLAIPRLPRYVQLIATFSAHPTIFGVPTQSISNGVDLDRVSPAKPSTPNPDELRLLAVANLSRAHAYDRLLQGLAQYRQNKGPVRVVFHLAGGGAEFERLTQMAQALELGDSVVFHGHCSGKALDERYDAADMAVGTLGAHRVNLTEASPLKAREYCAKGLPFVLGYRDTGLPENYPYAFSVPADESPVDVAALVDFYRHLIQQRPHFRQEIRIFAEQNFSWDAQMRLILQRLGL